MKTWTTVLLMLIAGTASAEDDLLADDRDNLKWIIDRGAGTAAVSKVDDSTPELTFNFAAAKRGPLEFNIRTDTDRVQVRLDRRGPRLDLNAGQENTLIVWVGEQPYVELNGERDEDWAEDLARAMERGDPETVSLYFSRADGVLVKYRQLPAPVMGEKIDPIGDDDAMATRTGRDDADSPAASVDTEALLNRAKAGIVELRIDRGVPGVFTVVRSPVLTDRHFVVVPARQLVGASGATVQLPGVGKTIEAKLVSFDPNVGLAMLELDTTFIPMARAAIKPVPIASSMPTNGEQVWLVTPTAAGPRLANLPVDELVSYSELDGGLQAAIRHNALSQWIQVNGTITTDQSGAAAFNGAGELVGLAAWAWADRSEASAILAATPIRSMIENPPAEPLGFAEFNETLSTVDLPRVSFAKIETVRDEPADQLRRVNAVLELVAECPACDGSGVNLERQRVGYEAFGTMRRAIYHNVYDQCAVCDGSGVKDVQAFTGAVETVISTAARLDASGLDAEPQLRVVAENLKQLTLANLNNIATMLNDDARQKMAGGSRNIGQPIVLIGTYVDEVMLPGESEPFRGVKVDGPDRTSAAKALVDQPRYVGTDEAPTAMVAGLLAGFVQQAADEPPVAVISHGLVIPIDPTQAAARKTVEQLNEELEAEREARRELIEERQRRIEREREREERERDRRY